MSESHGIPPFEKARILGLATSVASFTISALMHAAGRNLEAAAFVFGCGAGMGLSLRDYAVPSPKFIQTVEPSDPHILDEYIYVEGIGPVPMLPYEGQGMI